MVISMNSRPKSGQRYQNTVKFYHNKSSKKTKKINALPINGLCVRCTDKIVWRKTYRKYKPLTTPKRCTLCGEKAVKDAYHVICRPCANAKRLCEKCMEPHAQSEGAENKENTVVIRSNLQEDESSEADLSDEEEESFDDEDDDEEEGEEEDEEDEEEEEEDE